MKASLAVALSLTTVMSAAGADLLVKTGMPFVVVHPAGALPVERTAAGELAEYLKRAVGAETHVQSEETLPRPDAAQAYVGDCTFAREAGVFPDTFKSEGFVVVVRDGRLFIRGDDGPGTPFGSATRSGTLYGVYDFLERDVGVTWIWPGASGEDVPALAELKLAPGSRSDHPRLSFRVIKKMFSHADPPSDKHLNWDAFSKRLKLGRIEKTWFGHSWSRYLKEDVPPHPEWRARVNGERPEGHSTHYCTSNPDFRAFIAAQCLSNAFNRGHAVVSVSPSDGAGYCECAACRALDPPGTDYSRDAPNLSNRHWAYANDVARRVGQARPDLGVGMIAYSVYREPPTNIERFEPNLFVELCGSVAYAPNPDRKAALYELYEGWGKLGVKIQAYEYWGMHYWMGLPYVFTRQLKEAMPKLHQLGLAALHGEAMRNYGTQGPVYYLVAHQMWNPGVDADAVLRRFYRAFGPAAGHVRAYFDTFEDAIHAHQSHIPSFSYNDLINAWPEIFPDKTLRAAGNCLAKARAAVAGQPVYAERVKVIDIGYQYTEVTVKLITLYRRLGRAGVPLWCFGRAGIEAEYAYWREPGKSFYLNAMPKAWIDFIEAHLDEPLPPDEKAALLKEAWRLGESRERIINDSVASPAVIHGLYHHYVPKGIYAWHKTVGAALEQAGIPPASWTAGQAEAVRP